MNHKRNNDIILKCSFQGVCSSNRVGLCIHPGYCVFQRSNKIQMENKTEDYKEKIASIIKDNRIEKKITGLIMLNDNMKENNTIIQIIGKNEDLLSFIIDGMSRDKKTCDLFINAVFNFLINSDFADEFLTRSIFKDEFISHLRKGHNIINNK